MGLAAASVAGFVLRWTWMYRDSKLLRHGLTRVLPHVVDSVLLLAGAGLLGLTATNPFTQPWLVAKFTALLAYIVLGSIALKRGRTRRIRLVALVAALGAFGYLVGVALSRSPMSWLAY